MNQIENNKKQLVNEIQLGIARALKMKLDVKRF